MGAVASVENPEEKVDFFVTMTSDMAVHRDWTDCDLVVKTNQ